MSIGSKRRREAKRKREQKKERAAQASGTAEPKSVGRLAGANTGAYFELSEATGRRMSAAQIARAFSVLDREKTFVRLAEFAGALANRDDQSAEGAKFTRWVIERLAVAADPDIRAVGQTLATRMASHRTILHEKGIYLMQSLALTEGTASEAPPADSDLAILALAVNDYANDWLKSGEKSSESDRLMADFAHHARFNRRLDPLRGLTRSELILCSAPPSHRGLNTPQDWLAFQQRVFGRSYSDYVERLLGPLAIQSSTWMDAEGAFPLVNRKTWGGEMSCGVDEAEVFLGSLSLGVDAAATAIRGLRALDGVVRFPLPLYRTPFIEFDGGVACAASPWLVQHQLMFGFWGRCRAEMGNATSGFTTDTWLRVFGELFERYCRRLATEAEQSHGFGSRYYFVPSKLGGQDEIEDIVLVGTAGVALFSCKSRVMVERDVRAAASRDEIIRWLESFFFEDQHDQQRGGAFRLLDKKLKAIRQGLHEPTLVKTARIFPVIVTYDQIGESLYMTRWLRRRLTEENLLQGRDVAGPVVLDIKNYETLMSIAANGEDIFRILELCTTEEAGVATFNYVVRNYVAAKRKPPLSIFEREFVKLRERVVRHLRKDPPASEGGTLD